ncbi:MAG: DapH/DapD/GlmU-related protein [Patescibacteria group bacterium]|jgi:UDP-3-O-[3-hydroxymyristoyl] glucosamine N-acyltransferase
MYKTRKVEIYASEIAEILNLTLTGEDFIVKYPGSLENLQPHTVVYSETLTPEIARQLKQTRNILMILRESYGLKAEGFSYLVSPRPRLDFVRILNESFVERDTRQSDPTARISTDAKIGRNVVIGAHSVIGPDVVIGDNTIVLNNVVITGKVVIGRNCVIKDNATLGSEGYGFEFDEAGEPIHVPYVGSILIGDHVWIGANSAIERAEIDDTVIAASVKIDDLVQIGQSCQIGEHTMIAAGTVVSARVKIGNHCWLAPNVSLKDRITLADDVLVGIGAVVIHDCESHNVYAGNPARLLRRRTQEDLKSV